MWQQVVYKNRAILNIQAKGNYRYYYTYILSNKKNDTLYMDVTDDLKRRMFEHKHELIEGYTKNHGLNKLVYFERFLFLKDALKREKQLKNWKRQWKIDMIERDNKRWKDLSDDWVYQC